MSPEPSRWINAPSGTPQRSTIACAARQPAAALGTAPGPAPTVFNNVSAYWFWLIFISRTASVESGADRYETIGVPRVAGVSITSSMSTAGPRTSMPLAISAARNALTKNCVGLSTETRRADGEAPSAIEPLSDRVMLPGSRRVSIDVAVPEALVVTALTIARPLLPTERLIPAESPAAGPGDTVTRTVPSLYCSAPTPAESAVGRSSHIQPNPSVSSSKPLSSPITRPLIARMPRCFSCVAQSANTRSAMPSVATRLGSPLPTTMRSPCSVPPSIDPAAAIVVS